MLNSNNAPSLGAKVLHFAAAFVVHVKDGLQKCTEAEIIERLDVCQQCSSFQHERCLECGCGCSKDQIFFNKLAWRSEKCPLNKWRSFAARK